MTDFIFLDDTFVKSGIKSFLVRVGVQNYVINTQPSLVSRPSCFGGRNKAQSKNALGPLETETIYMFQRKITEKLLAWKADEKRKPLIVTGLRQIGKTTIVTDFGAKEYSSVLFFDFRKNKSLQSAFDGDFKVDDIVARLTAFSPSAPAVPHRTLFIFDEIQDCPNARSSLKYFALDGRYDVIATGSLLGVKGYRRSKKPSRGIPVGFEDTIQMYPMDFEEFCWAAGVNSTALAEIKRDLAERKTIPAFYHQMFLDLFRQYLCVGGMPEVVETYLATHDMRNLLNKVVV